jgi:hypothetical protein
MSSILCLREGVWGWRGDILKTQLPPAVWSGSWPGVPAAAGRSDGACRRGVVMHVTTRRCHPGGHPTSSMPAPVAHANAPHRVHTGDRQRHVQAALGRNTSSEVRQQAPGQIANEKWLTARQSATMQERQLLYLQYMPYCPSRRKITVGGNGLRHCVSRML